MAKYKIVGLPKQTEEYFELDLTPEEIEEYAKGGFIIEDISVPSLSHAQEGGEPKRKKHRFIKDSEEAKQFPADEWGQYIQEEPDVVVRPLTPEQQQERNMEWARREMARRNPHLYLPDGTLRPQAAQSADWVWQLGAMGPAGLEGLGALAAKQIPRTGVSLGTVANTVGGIHGATQVPQRIQDWQDVAAGKKDWREATAESLMTGLELYGGYDAARTLLPQTYKINPWALKENPEMYLYRTQPKDFVAGLTEEEYLKSLITDKIIKGEEVPWHLKGKLHKMQIAPEPFREALNKYHGQWFDKNPARMEWYMKGRLDDEVGDILRLKVPKSEGDAFNLKNFPEAQKASLNYESEFIVPRERLGQAEKFSTEDWKRLMQEDKAFNTPHWLKGYPKQLPSSPNSFSIFPRKPIPLSDRSLEFGKASKTVGGNQIPDNKWLPKPEPKPEHEWFNPENKKLYDEFTASLEEQAKRSQELSDFDAAAAMDKINASKLGPGVFKNLIMGDDLLWKTEEYLGTPYIPYTRRDLLREGNKLYPRVQYKPMDPFTKEQINVLNHYERSTNMLNEAEQAILDIKALRTEMEPRDFVRQFRYELMDPKTSKPYTIEQIKRASPQQISSWRKQIERNLLNPIYTEIQLQGLLPKVKASDFKYYSNKEGGQISSSKNTKLSKFIS